MVALNIQSTVDEMPDSRDLASSGSRRTRHPAVDSTELFSSQGLHHEFSVVSGNYVIPRESRQVFNTMPSLLDTGAAGRPDLYNILQDAAYTCGIFDDIILDDLKDVGRFKSKAQNEKNGDFSRVLDVCRGMIYVDNLDQIDRLVDYFSPAKNDAVVAFQNNFSRPDAYNGMRRLKIIVELPNKHKAEIQVRHKGMKEAEEETAKMYKQERQTKEYLETMARNGEAEKLKLAAGDTSCLNSASIDRIKLHAEQAKVCGLNAIEEMQLYFRVDGVPVVVSLRDHVSKDFAKATYAPYPEKAARVLVADPGTGFYVCDNSYLDNINQRKYTKIDREDFLRESIAMITEAPVSSERSAINYGEDRQTFFARNRLEMP